MDQILIINVLNLLKSNQMALNVVKSGLDIWNVGNGVTACVLGCNKEVVLEMRIRKVLYGTKILTFGIRIMAEE